MYRAVQCRLRVEELVLARLDEFLMKRVFQPVVDGMHEVTAPAEAACFCLTGAMVFVLAGMLASATVALPDWTVLLDLASLWAGMVLMRALSIVPAGRFNPFRQQFTLARRFLAFVSILLWASAAGSVAASFSAMRYTLWCMALYFASCDPPSHSRLRAVG
ncbi:MAG: hypothetical protein IRY87_00615 [Acetobacteraceae bacterium]|nr:hypothetical protein [Acetobacteraceae bacterium]